MNCLALHNLSADDPKLSTAADEERPRSWTSGFFTKFWWGEVPGKKKRDMTDEWMAGRTIFSES